MGSFGGHALPGSFFIVFGFWWTLQTARVKCQNDDVSLQKRKTKRYKNLFRTIFPCICFGYELPVESFMKVLFTFVGICVEINSASQSEAVRAADNQHIVMYATFFVNGICEIFLYYKTLVPKGADYFTGFLGFMVEGILFWFHIEHQQDLERMVHVLLIWVILICAVCSVVEAWIPDKLSFRYVRAFFVLLQGTWFFQIGFLIYNPMPGHPLVWRAARAHSQNMWVSVMFSWHCIGILIVQLMIIFFAHVNQNGCSFSKRCKTKEGTSQHELPLIDQKTMDEEDECFCQIKSGYHHMHDPEALGS